jgi:hypothetical protein
VYNLSLSAHRNTVKLLFTHSYHPDLIPAMHFSLVLVELTDHEAPERSCSLDTS